MRTIEITSHRQFLILWIEALRSGEYAQGQGALRMKQPAHRNEPDRFCCIGVGCEVMRSAGMVIRYLLPSGDSFEYGKYSTSNPGIERSAIGWPASVANWWMEIPHFQLNKVSGVLVRMNDEKKISFLEVADYLEREVLPLLPEQE